MHFNYPSTATELLILGLSDFYQSRIIALAGMRKSFESFQHDLLEGFDRDPDRPRKGKNPREALHYRELLCAFPVFPEGDTISSSRSTEVKVWTLGSLQWPRGKGPSGDVKVEKFRGSRFMEPILISVISMKTKNGIIARDKVYSIVF